MITKALLAKSRLFVSPLRFISLELRLEGLRQAKVIVAQYIEGCSYRNKITVLKIRTSYVAIFVDDCWLIRVHHQTFVGRIRLLSIHFLA
jgi:hypothetical protein